jgi:hypothetical protein
LPCRIGALEQKPHNPLGLDCDLKVGPGRRGNCLDQGKGTTYEATVPINRPMIAK